MKTDKLYNKEDGKMQTMEEIQQEFNELKANTNEFNRYTFDGFLKRYYTKRPRGAKQAYRC